MPIVDYNQLPSLARLRQQGMTVLTSSSALKQDIRELHIGVLNMMPDQALQVTERQFLRLIGESNPIAQFYIHLFTAPLARSTATQAHIAKYYCDFEQIKSQGLDALIVTGANVTSGLLSDQNFFPFLIEVFDWAAENVTSTLCSCLATHALLHARYQQLRQAKTRKQWGVFRHQVCLRAHPLVHDLDTHFDVPHSRWNDLSAEQFDQAGMITLIESNEVGVHLAVSADGLRFVCFQGHPEYDTVSLLKECKREFMLWYQKGNLEPEPDLPQHYFSPRHLAILAEYCHRLQVLSTKSSQIVPKFPEHLIAGELKRTWGDTAMALIRNWLGCVYQVTNRDRSIPFMSGIDPENPLQLDLARLTRLS